MESEIRNMDDLHKQNDRDYNNFVKDIVQARKKGDCKIVCVRMNDSLN